MENKCQIGSHSQRSLITVCLAVGCEGKRVCCSMCQAQIHKDHIAEMLDFKFLKDFITSQSQKPITSSQKVKYAIEVLNIVLKHVEDLTKLIKEEIKRLGSANLQTFCKNLGNKYKLFTEQIGNQQWNDLTQEMLSQVELKNGEIIEKDSLETHLGLPYSLFIQSFSQTLTNIEDKTTIMSQIDPNPFMKLTVPRVLIGHKYAIQGIDICEKRNLLVSGSTDHTVKLWNLQDNTLLQTYSDICEVRDAVFSSEGKFLAFGGISQIISLIELKDFKNNDIVSKLSGHKHSIFRLTFSNDEIYLISGGNDFHLRVWNVQAKEQLFKLVGISSVYGLTMSRDDTFIASHTYDQGINIWNIKNQKLWCTQKGHSNGAGIQFSNDQQMLVSSGVDGIIKLWSLSQLDKGKLLLIKEFEAANSSIYKVLLTKDSKFIIFHCSGDKVVKVIDSNTGQQVKLFHLNSYDSHQDHMGVAITNSLSMIAYGNVNKIELWMMGIK